MLNSEKLTKIVDGKLTGFLRQVVQVKAGPPKDLSLEDLINKGSEVNPGVRFYRNELHTYRRIRNTITHDKICGCTAVEPTDSAIAEIERVLERLTSPPRITDIFHKDVYGISIDTSIGEAATVIRENSYCPASTSPGGRRPLLLRFPSSTSPTP